ncbi:hypothetical protein ACSSV5_001231 [Psychroflexus sp. MBR-150]|jgi:hypothetical protein
MNINDDKQKYIVRISPILVINFSLLQSEID